VSLQHAVAAALLQGKAGLAQFTDACVADPAVSDLRRRIEVAADQNLSTIAVDMVIWTRDGTKQSLATQAARGSPANPLKDSEIEDKLLAEAASWRPGHDVRPLIEAVWSLERLDDAARLATMTVPPA
jgi:2-methylcitrate dehydratase PrpD